MKIISRIKKNYFAMLKYVGYYKRCKINSKMILLESQKGTQVKGNIYYLLKELSKEEYKKYKIYLSVTKESKQYISKLLLSNNINRVKLIKVKSFKYNKILAKAKYLINDLSFFPYFIKKEGQVYLNTWHGTPLKTLGKRVKNAYLQIGCEQKSFVLADYLLYPNEFTRDIFLDDYMIRNTTNAKVILEGYPRNTAFFEDEKIIRKKYNLEDKFIITYMPTWRGIASNQHYIKQEHDIKLILDNLEKKLKKDQLVYVNLHPIEKATVDFSPYKKIKPFPDDIETYEFLNIADVLITDYSSVFFDFAIKRKKIILFPHDKEDYLKERGMYFEMESLPFPVVYSIKDLVKEINSDKNYDEEDFVNKYLKYDNKDATKNILKTVLFNDKKLCKLENIKKNGKENVLIYAGNLSTNSITLTLKSFLNNIDLKEKNYYIYVDALKTKRNDNIILEYIPHIQYISVFGKRNLNLIQKIINRLYVRKIISLKTMLRLMGDSYNIELKRIFGEINFSSVINFNSSDYYKDILFSKLNCKKIIYLFNEDNALLKNNKRSREILNYVSNSYDKIIVDSDKLVDKLSKITNASKITKLLPLINYENIDKYINSTNFISDYTVMNTSKRYLKKAMDSSNQLIATFVNFNDIEEIKKIVDCFAKINNSNIYLFIIGTNGYFFNDLIDYCYSKHILDNVIIIRNINNFYPLLKRINNYIFYNLDNNLFQKNVLVNMIGVSKKTNENKYALIYKSREEFISDNDFEQKIDELIENKLGLITSKEIKKIDFDNKQINKIFK